jgi:hypothetical protein
MKRLLLLLAALLACGLIAAGCGDDDDGDGDDSPATTETAPADTTETTDTTESEDESLEDSDSVEQAIEDCKDSVDATGDQLSEETKSDLVDLCEQAASGDEEEVREAGLEICKRIVEETVPDEATREQALAACESAVAE